MDILLNFAEILFTKEYKLVSGWNALDPIIRCIIPEVQKKSALRCADDDISMDVAFGIFLSLTK